MKRKIKIIIFSIIALILLSTFITIIELFMYQKEQNKTETIFQNEEIVNKIVFSNESEENFDGIIGYLTIESIGLIQAPIKEGTEMETLNEYIGHFTDSNFLEGNVALAGHNRGYSKNYFENLKNLKEDELIIYQTKQETKTYKVQEIKEVSATDVEIVAPTEDNRITLITCVENNNNIRLVIIGKEI